MVRYKLILAYDGTDFSGSQRQARGRTVQSELEKAARRLGWKGTTVLLAGRTDAGVHASGQVAAFDLDWRHDTEALRVALNAGLPSDVAVTEVQRVGDTFHPRFDAISRTYAYSVRSAPSRHPLEDRSSWRVWPAVRLADMNRVARSLRGTHDFGAFGSAPRKGSHTTRTVSISEWKAKGDYLTYVIRADAFLYRMVRRLVFVQVAVGQGRCKERVIRESLLAGRPFAGLPAGLAPAQGLRLTRVGY